MTVVDTDVPNTEADGNSDRRYKPISESAGIACPLVGRWEVQEA